MDLKDIEEWGRELLQSEARKRGVKNPEMYSRGTLVRMILKQDYGAPRNVRDAAKLIGGIWGSAKKAVQARLGSGAGTGVRTYVGAAREHGRSEGAGAGRTFDARTASAGSAKPRRGDAGARDESRDSDAQRDANNEPFDASIERAAKPDADQDALREAARVRSESRDTRRDAERVRADARAGIEEHVRPESGWHELPLAGATHAREPGESDESDADVGQSGRQLSAAARGPDQTPARSGESGVRRAADELKSRTDDAEPARASETLTPHLRLVESPADAVVQTSIASRSATLVPEPMFSPPSLPDAPRMAAPFASAGASRVESEVVSDPAAQHLTYGPHPHDGMLVRWQVTPEAIERARKVLGTDGELAVRIVVVRVNLHAVVKTDVIDHGPVAAVGDWTAPLLPSEARYVSAVGLRSPMRFVSIVHASS